MVQGAQAVVPSEYCPDEQSVHLPLVLPKATVQIWQESVELQVVQLSVQGAQATEPVEYFPLRQATQLPPLG